VTLAKIFRQRESMPPFILARCAHVGSRSDSYHQEALCTRYNSPFGDTTDPLPGGKPMSASDLNAEVIPQMWCLHPERRGAVCPLCALDPYAQQYYRAAAAWRYPQAEH
jgi:hypothetical protein